MADTGYNWEAAWSAYQKSAVDWTSDDLADAATETGDALDCDGKAAVQISITAVEDNTGAIDGAVTVHIMREVDDGTFETQSLASFAASFTPVQNATVYKSYPLDCSQWNQIKVAVENQSGQTLAISVKYIFATVPAAS